MTDGLDIDHLAKLARIRLTDEEKQQLQTELPAIVGFFSQIEQVGRKEIVENERVVASNELRPDELGSGPAGLTIAELEKLAPEFINDQVVVPAVFETQESA